PVLLTLSAYVVTIGAPASARRALVMVACAVAGTLAWKRVCLVHAVALASVVLLCLDPAAVLDPGAQLSVCACLGIALALHGRVQARSWSERVTAGARVSFAAGVATAPIVLDLQGTFALVGFAVNLVVVPVVGLIIFPTMLAGIAMLNVSTTLAHTLLSACTWSMEALRTSLAWAATLPGAHLSPTSIPPVALAAVSFGVFVALGVRSRRARLFAWFLVLTISCGPWSPHRHRKGTLRIHALPVGQGDATLVEFPDGRAWLIDAGGRRTGPDVGASIVVPTLRRLGVRELDALVITHADLDHIGGAVAVLRMIPTGRLFVHPGERREAMKHLVSEAQTLAIPVVSVHAEHSEVIAEASVHIAAPPTDDSNPNDSSLVTALAWHDVRVVFPGDLESTGEAWWVEHHGARATILKAGHHGSGSSTSSAWLQALDPELVLLSCGPHNPFGHPHPDVVSRVVASGAQITRTDTQGLVRVTLDSDGVIEAQITHSLPD
ncbi:MAG: ComEC/Rec2 family competence protein, partial [Myxococcota bacterium]